MTTEYTAPAVMTREQAQLYAEHWIADWSSKQIDAVLARFTEQAQFTSPGAEARIGMGTLYGKDSLRRYWTGGAAMIKSISFTLDHVLWDAESGELAIVYTAMIDDDCHRAVELLRFDGSGKVVRGEALYGVGC